jgi:hypothetical protein
MSLSVPAGTTGGIDVRSPASARVLPFHPAGQGVADMGVAAVGIQAAPYFSDRGRSATPPERHGPRDDVLPDRREVHAGHS